MAEYNKDEQAALKDLQKTNFKNLSKNDAMNICYQLSQLKQEQALEYIKMYPELGKLIHSTLNDYVSEIDKIILSDDKSIEHVCNICEKSIDAESHNFQQVISIAKDIREDCSKCLDKDNLTPEERDEILNREFKILQTISAQYSESHSFVKDVINTADRKDSEKRNSNMEIVKTVTCAVFTVIYIAASVASGRPITPSLPKR